MRWGVFILFLFIAMVLDTAFLNVLQIGGVAPAVTPCLAVFIALGAPRQTALWGCLIIGIFMDLTTRMTLAPERGFYLIGPWALGYLAGCHLLLPLRTMVFRRNPLTIGVMTILFLFAAALVAVTVLLVRSWFPNTELFWQGGTAFREYVARCVWALYCGALAVPMGWILTRTTPWWGFHPSVQRSARW